MSDTTMKSSAGALLTAAIAAIAAVCACHTEDGAPPLAHPAVSAAAASSQPPSFVGTAPASRSDDKAITPMETVGAGPN